MPKFLSEAWFDEVEKIRAAMGDIPVPDTIKHVIINVVILGHPEGDKNITLNAGAFKRGHTEGAPTTLKLPYDVAVKMFVDRDPQAGMQAFMAGQIQVEGDMSLVMQMQNAGQPSDKQKEFAKKVAAITEK